MQPATTEKEYEIRFYDVDFRKRLLVARLMNYFEDSAISQSERLGVGLFYLHQNKMAWVVHQWNIRIDRHPLFMEKIKIKTYPDGIYKYYAFRHFDVADASGAKIVSADSTWLLLDAERKKPIKIPEYFFQAYGIDRELADDSKILKLKEPLRVDNDREFKVRFLDMDINNHVNNVRYFEWVYESLPNDILTNYTLKNLKMTFKKEAKYGDTIMARSEVKLGREEFVCYHKLMDEMKAELCFAETDWKKD